jgi:hypothetical protein
VQKYREPLKESKRQTTHLVEVKFCRLKERACTSELEDYAGGSVAARRASNTGEAFREITEREEISGPQSVGLGVGLHSHLAKTQLYRNTCKGDAMNRKRAEVPMTKKVSQTTKS